LVVGALVYRLMPNRRPQSVADVIEATTFRGGWMSSRVGLRAALISALSIGTGASVGREGPAIHLGASISGWIGRRLHLHRALTRTLLGCGVAAAVAASFNAPIAGALFASEVVVGHYALKAFAPIVIASVAGTALSRAWFGNFPAFALNDIVLESALEFPAIVMLGIISGIAAIIFMHSIRLAQQAAEATPIPIWLRPAVAGLMVGLIALAFPQVLGVGYGVTESALLLEFSLLMCIAIGLAKIGATAISLGWGFGGGVFSPSLVIGAMVGAAFGIIATAAFPEQSAGPTAYTVVGMGAVAAAVLGAPISTTLIVFEMTSNYALTLGVMVAVVISSLITHHFYGRSFFDVQLKHRGIDVKGGFESEIMHSIHMSDVLTRDSETVGPETSLEDLRQALQRSPTGELFVVLESGELLGTITLADLSDSAFDHGFDDVVLAGDVARMHPPVLTAEDDLETATALIMETGEEHIAVVKDKDCMTFRGCVHQRDIMNAYNKALVKSRHEEHGND
jgi:CIC family chloride channel protein